MPPRVVPDVLESPIVVNDEAWLLRAGPSWTAITGRQLRDRVRSVAAALIHYGFGPGDAAALAAPGDPEALELMLAVAACGGVAVPVDPSLPEAGLFEALRRSRCRLAVTWNDEILRRVVFVRADLSDLELVLVVRPSPSERPTAALRLDAARSVGGSALAGEPDLLTGVVRGIDADSPAWVAPGSAGPASHAELLRLADATAGQVGLTASDRVLLAAGGLGPALVAPVIAALAAGATVAFAGEDLAADLREVGPTLLVAEGRRLDALRRARAEALSKRSWPARKIHAWSLAQGLEPSHRPWATRLAEALALRRLREDLGGRLRGVGTLGGAIDPEAARDYRAVGVAVVEVSLP